MPEGLKIVVGAETQAAEKALNDLIKDFDRTGDAATKLGSEFNKAFGRAPLSSIEDYTKSIQNLKKNLAGVTIGPVAGGGGIATAVEQLKKVPPASNQATAALINLSRVAQDAPFGFLGIANNLNPLLESFQRLKAESGSTSGALKNLVKSLGGAGGIGLALGVASSLLIVFGDALFGTKKKAEESKEALEALRDTVQKVANDIKALSAAVDFANQLGAINIKISGLGDLTDLRGQSVAQAALVEQIGNKIVTAKENVAKAELEVQNKSNDDTKALLKEARKALSDAQDEEAKARDKGRLIFRQIELQKKTDAEQAAKDAKALLDKTLAEQKKFIADAKELAKELEKIGFVEPKFGFFDTFQEQLAKARKVFADFKSGNLKLNKNFFDVDLTLQAPRPDAIAQELNTFQDAVQKGLVGLPPVTVPAELTPEQEGIARVISEFNEKFTKAGIKFSIPAELNFDGTASNAGNLLQADFLKKLKLKGLQDRLDEIVKQFTVDLLVGLGEAIGQALGGATSVFDALFKIIGAGMKQFGEALIALGIAKKALDSLFKGKNGGVLAIGAGIALIALSSVVSNFAGPKFAKGGLVTGPTLGLVGEGRGTSSSNPEVIAPLDKLKGMLGDIGGGRQTVVVMGKIRGKDLTLSGVRTSKSQSGLGVGQKVYGA